MNMWGGSLSRLRYWGQWQSRIIKGRNVKLLILHVNMKANTGRRKREMKKSVTNKTIAFLLVAAMCVSLCTGFTANAQEPSDEIAASQEPAPLPVSNLSDPRIEKDSSMKAGQKVTWDCVWFGSYPQAEVVPSADSYTAVDKSLLKSGDII